MNRGIDTTEKIYNILPNIKHDTIDFVIRYIDDANSWKALTSDELTFIERNKLYLILVFEKNPTHTLYFTSYQGTIDAENLKRNLVRLNLNKYKPTVYFTVDYDADEMDLIPIKRYFDGIIASVKDININLGVYGSNFVISQIYDFILKKYDIKIKRWLSLSKGWRNYYTKTEHELYQSPANDNFDWDISNGDAGGILLNEC